MAPIIYGILAIVVFWFFFLRKTHSITDIPQGSYCHWCGLKPVTCLGDPLYTSKLILNRCPNCGEQHLFHAEHRLAGLQPFCEGKYVGDPSGHTFSLTDKRCAKCHLPEAYWSKWHCSPNVNELNNKQLQEAR